MAPLLTGGSWAPSLPRWRRARRRRGWQCLRRTLSTAPWEGKGGTSGTRSKSCCFEGAGGARGVCRRLARGWCERTQRMGALRGWRGEAGGAGRAWGTARPAVSSMHSEAGVGRSVAPFLFSPRLRVLLAWRRQRWGAACRSVGWASSTGHQKTVARGGSVSCCGKHASRASPPRAVEMVVVAAITSIRLRPFLSSSFVHVTLRVASSQACSQSRFV